jgi:hypothetical protein
VVAVSPLGACPAVGSCETNWSTPAGGISDPWWPTAARNNSSETVIARANLVAFDASTKEISTTFAPNPNGTVNVVLPTGDGETVYVGGSFTTISGQTRKNLVKVRVSDGSIVTAFNAGNVAGQVKDLRLGSQRRLVCPVRQQPGVAIRDRDRRRRVRYGVRRIRARSKRGHWIGGCSAVVRDQLKVDLGIGAQ